MAGAPVFTGGMSYFWVEVYTRGFKSTFVNSYSIAGECFRRSGDHWKYFLFSRGFVLMGKVDRYFFPVFIH